MGLSVNAEGAVNHKKAGEVVFGQQIKKTLKISRP